MSFICGHEANCSGKGSGGLMNHVPINTLRKRGPQHTAGAVPAFLQCGSEGPKERALMGAVSSPVKKYSSFSGRRGGVVDLPPPWGIASVEEAPAQVTCPCAQTT